MTEVVAALIWKGNRFLACQRAENKARGLLWEFPGGKVEAGETRESALARECREELGIEIDVGEIFAEVFHEYPDMKVHLTLFNAEITEGEPKLLEHNALRWITTGEMDELDFCPADSPILKRLSEEFPEPVTDTIARLSGECACGKSHETSVKDVRIESGLRHMVGEILKENGFGENLLFVADENTRAAADGIEESLRDFNVEKLLYKDLRIATMEEVERVESRIEGRDISVLSVGTGSLNDICRLASARQGKKFAIFGTAPSMDGFASYSAPIVKDGFKFSYPAKSPEVILADTEVLAKSPAKLKSAGFGDMIAKYTAIADWKISSLLTSETYCERVAKLSLKGADSLMGMAKSVTVNDERTAGKIFSSLLLTGIGMSFMQNSRPASGSEHIIAHLIDCKEIAQGKIPNLHGEDVGVCTLLILKLYEKLAKFEHIHARRENLDWDEIFSFYGNMRGDVERLNFPQSVTAAIEPAALEESWPKIREILRELPKYETCLEAMQSAGCKVSISQIGKDRDFVRDCARFSPFMRRRVTLLRLIYMIEEGDTLWEDIC